MPVNSDCSECEYFPTRNSHFNHYRETFSELEFWCIYQWNSYFNMAVIMAALIMGILDYRNDPTFSETQNICCNHSKVWTMWLYHTLMSPNDADGMENSVDPDQTAPKEAVWSGSALFAQAYLSENLGSLRYNACNYMTRLNQLVQKINRTSLSVY